VQDRLRESTETLKQWLAEGAVIYICGSLQGMASGVDHVLNETLGIEEVDRLIEQGRYRRDVY
jgi:sulfite reductase (NADPH) flavoprotein alpha-component